MMYETVKSKFDKYFIPKRNVIYGRVVFNSRKQAEGETVDAFITALHTLSEHCQYGPLRDEMIRDRIVVGIRNVQLLEKLQNDSELTLAKATAQVCQTEAIKMQQPALRGAIIDSAAIAPIQRDKTQLPKTQYKRPFRKGKYTEAKAIKPGNGSTCPKCGKGHPRDKLCPACEAVCHKCKKRGHFQVMCRATAKVAGIQEGTADYSLEHSQIATLTSGQSHISCLTFQCSFR